MGNDTRRSFFKKSLLTMGMTQVALVDGKHTRESSADFSSDVTSAPYPWTHLNFPKGPNNFRFAIVPDLTGRERPGVFLDAVQKLNMLQPEFVISSGDVIEGHTNDKAELNSDWDLFLEHVAPLEMPFFYLGGNHDYWYSTLQDPEEEPIVYDMRDVYEKHAGPPYYHFVYHDVLFLILQNTVESHPGNTEALAAEFYAKQKEYVTRILTQSHRMRWTFVFVHYPNFFSWQLSDHITSLLGNRPFTIIGGNSHEYVYYDRGNRDYINVATVGGMSRMRGVQYGEIDHLLWVTMLDDGPRFANLLLGGIYPKNVRTDRSAARTSSLLTNPPISAPILFQAPGPFQPLTTQIRIANTSDYELNLLGHFESHDNLVAQPATIQIQVAPTSEQSVDIKLRNVSLKPALVEDISPLVLSWTATQELTPQDPQVTVSGKLRIIVDVQGERLPASKPAVVDEFTSKTLAPGWVALGPGGRHSDTDRYTLTDEISNPPRLQQAGDDRWYTDGRGVYALTPLWSLPLAGIYRDIPPDTFDCRLRLGNIQWGGDIPVFRWEFWDNRDEAFHYGPKYLSGVILQLTQRSNKGVVQLFSFDAREKLAETSRSQLDSLPYFPDSRWKPLGEAELPSLPTRIALRAQWRESLRSWMFSYGLEGEDPRRPISNPESSGGSFLEKIAPSSEGKRNLIYVRQAAKDKGFSVSLEKYILYV